MRILNPTIRIIVPTMLLWGMVCFLGGAKGDTPRADRIIIFKNEHVMKLMRKGEVLKMYGVALGREPRGPKVMQGDRKTPEGLYTVDSKISRSRFHLALHISYPNAADAERARKLGVSPGGALEIHGLPESYAWLGSSHRLVDWTDGCIAVTNPEIEEIWDLVPVGTPVAIRP